MAKLIKRTITEEFVDPEDRDDRDEEEIEEDGEEVEEEGESVPRRTPVRRRR